MIKQIVKKIYNVTKNATLKDEIFLNLISSKILKYLVHFTHKQQSLTFEKISQIITSDMDKIEDLYLDEVVMASTV